MAGVKTAPSALASIHGDVHDLLKIGTRSEGLIASCLKLSAFWYDLGSRVSTVKLYI